MSIHKPLNINVVLYSIAMKLKNPVILEEQCALSEITPQLEA
jgi:hypothetical protein